MMIGFGGLWLFTVMGVLIVSFDLMHRVMNASFLEGQFVLSSGGTSNFYFDHFQLAATPDLFHLIVQKLVNLVPPSTEVIAGVVLGGAIFAAPLSLALSLPVAFVREHRKMYGTCRQVEGANVQGKSVCIVEDIVSTGGHIAQAGKALRDAGAVDISAICIVDRGEGKHQRLLDLEIDLKYLWKMDELLAVRGLTRKMGE